MAALILPSRRVVQPQGPVEVDWANPIARGLVGFWYPDGQLFRSAINGYPDGIPTVNATFDAAGKGRKIGRVGTAARTATIARDVRQRPGVKMTLLAEGVAPSRLNSGQNYWLGAEASSAGFGVYLTSAGLRPYLRVGGTFADQISGVLAGQSAQVGFTFSGSTYWVVADGKQKVSQSISGAINHSTVDLALTSISGSGSNLGDGSFYYLAIWDRDLSALELDSFYGNPWQVLRPIQRRIIVDMGAGGSAVDLAPSDASHTHTADNAALTSSTGLAVNSASHAHSAESFVLTTSTALSVADTSHAQAADNLTLGTTSAVALAVADASHAHAADSTVLVVASVLAVADAAHAHAADSVGLTTVESLTVASAGHAHSAENVDLTIGGIGLAVSDATHAHSADALNLSADAFLITADATHGHAADLLTLSTSVFFAVDDAVHAQTADNLSLDGAPTLQVAAAQHQHAAETVALTMESWLQAANAAHSHTAQNITLSTDVAAEPLTNAEMRELLESVRVLRIQLQQVNGYTSLIPALL